MKTLLIAFLVATACIGIASPLNCYTCEPTMSIGECENFTECDESDNYCISEIIMGYDDLIYGFTKGCAPTCSEESEYRGKRRIPTKCCDTDLCNDD